MNDSLDMIISSLANLFAVTAVTEFALNWLVQSTLLIAAGLFLARMLQAKGSATQSLICRTTLVAVLVCPLATWTLSQLGASGWSIRLPNYPNQSIQELADAEITPDLDSSAPPAAAEPQALSVDESPISLPNHHLSEFPFQNQSLPAATDFDQSLAVEDSPNRELSEPNEPAEQHVVAASTMATSDGPTTKSFNWLDLLTLCISIGWITISAVFLTRLIAAWWRLSRLVQRARPAEAATRQLCEELAAPIGVNVPEILRSPFLASPCLTGLGLTRRSSILLPEDDSHLPMRDVLVHELAHLRRHDVHWNLFRQVATAIYFFQPLLWVLSRRIEITAEEVCDDFVVQFGGDRERYATQLVDIAELSTDVSAAAVATAGVGIVALRSMLARRVERIMDGSRELSTRVGGLLLLLVLIVGLVGTSVVGLVGLNNAPTLAEATVAETELESDESGSDELESEVPSKSQSLERTGQVLDDAGNPVAGAKIYNLFHYFDTAPPTSPLSPVAISDATGEFRFIRPEDPAGYQCTVAVKEGFGLAISTVADQQMYWYGEDAPKSPLVLRLVVDHRIKASIVDINGDPVAGAQLRFLGADTIINEDLRRWHKVANAPKADSQSLNMEAVAQSLRASGLSLQPLIATATTDAKGRCEMGGVGKDRIAHYLLSGPNIETTKIHVRTEPGKRVAVVRFSSSPEHGTNIYYPSEFQHIGAPSVAVTGVVRASDSGEPIEGVTLKVLPRDDDSQRLSNYLQTVTDAKGRYRLLGMPMSEYGPSMVAISARPSMEDVTDDALNSIPAFLPASLRISTANATKDVNVDIDLERGSWLTGSVNDRASGDPISGKFIHYTSPTIGEDLPNGKELLELEPQISDRQGRFRLVVPQSKGLLAFSSHVYPNYPVTRHVLKLNGQSEKLDANVKMKSSIANHPANVMKAHLIAEYDATDGAVVEDFNLKLGSGITRTGTVLSPDGKPVDDFYYTGSRGQVDRKWTHVAANENQKSEITLSNYEPEHPRKVHVVVPDKNLAGFAEVSGNAEEPFVVKLVAGATVTGRVLDEEDKPIANSWVIVSPSPTPFCYLNKTKRGRVYTDAEGRFEISSLLPDTDHNFSVLRAEGGYSFLPLDAVANVPSGEKKALGDFTFRNRVTDGEGSPQRVEVTERKAATKQNLEYSGQVLDPDGKPVAGANIYHVYYMSKPMGLFEPTSKPVTISGVDGRFRFEFTHDGSLRSSGAAKYGTAFATKKGFGFGIAHRENTAAKPEDVLSLANRSKDIHLLKDHPIRGRIVNIDGEPVAGARLILTRLSITPNNDLGSWNEASKEPNADFYSVLKNVSNIWRSPQLPSLVAPITTDRDGRFEVRGIGEGQIAHFHLSGPSIETAIVNVRTEETGDTITLPWIKRQKTKISFTYYPSRFEHIAGPSVPVSGVVTASDTGDPISGATVKSEGADRDIVRAITDENGRYRLEGLPIRERNYIAVLAPSTSNNGDEVPAYLSLKKTVSTTEPTENIDIKMERGSWLFGRITDPETGKGLPGRLEYRIPEKMNSRKGQVYESDRWVSGQDGRFRIVVPKGRGYIAFSASNFSEYPRATKILSLDGKMGRASEVKRMRSSLPACLIAEYQADDETCERNLEISKAPTRTGKVVGPDGQPVTDYYYLSDSDYRNWDKSISDGFTLKLYDPDASRDVYFSNLENNLTAHAVVSGPTDEPLVVQLVKGGTATGRVVDEDGDPVANFELSPTWKAPAGNGDTIEKISYISPLLPYNFRNSRGRGANVTDAEGRFTLTCLLPDTEYQVVGLGVIKVKAGESKDLGDIKYGAGQVQAMTDSERRGFLQIVNQRLG